MKSNYLTIEQQIFILELSKKDLYEYPHFGLCAIVKNNLRKTLDLSDCVEDIEIAQYIPIFTYENALLFKANKVLQYSESVSLHSHYWWSIKDTKNRIKYLNYLIKLLKNLNRSDINAKNQ